MVQLGASIADLTEQFAAVPSNSEVNAKIEADETAVWNEHGPLNAQTIRDTVARVEAVKKAVRVLEVVSLCRSSSDELSLFPQIGYRFAGWNMKTLLSYHASLGRLVSAVVFLFALVSWWEHRGTAILGTVKVLGCCVWVGRPQYHDSVIFCGSF